MITKRDCILLLSELQERGIDTSLYLKKALKTNEVDIQVLKFINEHRPFEASLFYEKLRKSYNNKKSMLYKNIVTCDEGENTQNVLTTLSSLNLQIFLFADTLQDSNLFLTQIRAEEITYTLLNYLKTYDLVPCIKVLQLIKADLKAFEYINK